LKFKILHQKFKILKIAPIYFSICTKNCAISLRACNSCINCSIWAIKWRSNICWLLEDPSPNEGSLITDSCSMSGAYRPSHTTYALSRVLIPSSKVQAWLHQAILHRSNILVTLPRIVVPPPEKLPVYINNKWKLLNNS